MSTTAATFLAFDRARISRLADWLAVGVALSMPWSVSVSQILTVTWLLALIPTLDLAMLRRELQSWAGGLPVLIWLMALTGMLWATVSWGERLAALESFDKLLVIPLLLAQFRRSERGLYVVAAFLASCTLLLVASWTSMVLSKYWSISQSGRMPGLLVKDYIAQSTEFLICAFGLLGFAAERWRVGQRGLAGAAVALSCVFVANIFYIAPGRTALAVIPLLLVIFGYHYFGWKGVFGACIAGVMIAAAAWEASPFLRARVLATFSEVQAYERQDAASPSDIRLELWRQSLGFVADAPFAGHGTGSIQQQFRDLPDGGALGQVAVNPHNQLFAVAIQLGLVGTAILIAMWVAHLALFRAGGLIPWIGIVLVVQNLASAPFNSHLFDSFHGWLYVFGVGVVGGMALRESRETA